VSHSIDSINVHHETSLIYLETDSLDNESLITFMGITSARAEISGCYNSNVYGDIGYNIMSFTAH
jgi:hypothetical protein